MSDKFVINCHDLYNYCFILCFFVLILRKLFVKNKNRFTKKTCFQRDFEFVKNFHVQQTRNEKVQEKQSTNKISSENLRTFVR